MNVNGYVEWFNEMAAFGKWERCAEFKYSDDAILYAKAAWQANKCYSYRAVRCHADDMYGSNGEVWNSDRERDAERNAHFAQWNA